MLYADLKDIQIDVFGGYTPAIPPSNLPPGASPFCQDVEFPKGAVRTRGGLRNLGFGLIPVNAKINGLKSYITPTLDKRLMVWDSLGNLYKENPQGTLNLVGQRPYKDLLYQSTTIFGREYQTFFDVKGGFDIPRQFDDTNWDRVSQGGPGEPPIVGDDNSILTIAAIAGSASMPGIANITSISMIGNLVTVVTAVPFGQGLVQESIVIAGVPVGGYNGTFPVASVISPTSFTYVLNTVGGLAAAAAGTAQSQCAAFAMTSLADPTGTISVTPQKITVASVPVGAYNGTWTQIGIGNWGVPKKLVIFANLNVTGLANSQTGIITFPGNITAGLRNVTVAFVTRQGFITRPAVAPTSWVATGGKRCALSNIATGPSNIIARLLLFTLTVTPPATTGDFFSLPNGDPFVPNSVMLIPDNTSTSYIVDFTDQILSGGFQGNYLFTQLELGECARVDGYNSRLQYLGERNKQQDFINMGFEGGWSGNRPLGWTLDIASGVGTSSANAAGLPGDWQDALAITGDGATAVVGKIFQTAARNYLGTPLIAQNVGYGVRVRIALANGLDQGTLHINLQSGRLGLLTVGLVVPAVQLTNMYAEFTANLTDAPLANPPADLKLQVYADGTPTAGGIFLVDSIEVYPLNAPVNYSTARFSHAFNPESFDGTTGSIQVRPDDGQQLRAAFPIRENSYLAKDNYLCYTADDGVNEPSSWPVVEVSATVGICGPNAVDWTEEWAVFAHRTGVYICWGSDPVKINQEIEEDASLTGKVAWDSINWRFGHTIWIRIDQTKKVILIGAPVNGATSPNVIFTLDYKWLDSGQDIAASPMVTYSAFTGKILAHGRGRRWAPWNITANSMCFAERTDGTAQPFFGNGIGNGKVYQKIPVPLQLSDDGVAINSRYDTYYFPASIEEDALELGASRKLFGYLKFQAMGAGSMLMSFQKANIVTILRSYSLSLNPAGDGKRPINSTGERFSMQYSTFAIGSWFQLEKVIPFLRKSATIVTRGVST